MVNIYNIILHLQHFLSSLFWLCITFFASLSVFENIDLCMVEEVEVECKKFLKIKDLYNKIWSIFASKRFVKTIVKVLVDMKINSLNIIPISILNVFA